MYYILLYKKERDKYIHMESSGILNSYTNNYKFRKEKDKYIDMEYTRQLYNYMLKKDEINIDLHWKSHIIHLKKYGNRYPRLQLK